VKTGFNSNYISQ